jgi:hypothetical protein
MVGGFPSFLFFVVAAQRKKRNEAKKKRKAEVLTSFPACAAGERSKFRFVLQAVPVRGHLVHLTR